MSYTYLAAGLALCVLSAVVMLFVILPWIAGLFAEIAAAFTLVH